MTIKIHPSGYLLLLVLSVLFVLLLITGILSHNVLLITAAGFELAVMIFVLVFFRNPARSIHYDDKAILAPADGRVKVIRASADSVKDSFHEVSIYLSLFDVHVNRMPVSGVVLSKEKQRGRTLPAFLRDADSKNAFVSLNIKTARGTIKVTQLVGFLARRIQCDVKTGEKVKQGDIFGIIRFGSRVNVQIPGDTELLVREGQSVKAGLTSIGKYKSE